MRLRRAPPGMATLARFPGNSRTFALVLALPLYAWLCLLCQSARGESSPQLEAPATCQPYVHWLSQGVGPGETVMVVGWCFGPKPTLLLDGKTKLGVTIGIGGPLHNYTEYGPARSLMSDPLPSDLPKRRHTVAVVTDDGRVSNTVGLNDADLWWVQGDEGEEATAGGWIRAFGRELVGPSTDRTQEPPQALEQEWGRLVRHGAWDASVQLERLRGLVTSHADWLTAPPATPTTTLTLSPTSDSLKPVSIIARAGHASSYAAEFVVPIDVAPGEYNVSIRSGPEGALSPLDCFENLNRTRVRSIVIKAAMPTRAQRPTIFVDGPSGLNQSQDPFQVPGYGTTGPGTPIDATPILKAALAKAQAVAESGGVGVTVAFRAGVFHLDGPIIVPDGVTIAGAGSDLTALYFSYDNISTAPQVLLGPSAASNSWELVDLSIYVLGFFRTVVHVPGDQSGRSRFRMTRVTVRADAFHCQNGFLGRGGGRSPPWFPNCDGTCGTQGGYESAVHAPCNQFATAVCRACMQIDLAVRTLHKCMLYGAGNAPWALGKCEPSAGSSGCGCIQSHRACGERAGGKLRHLIVVAHISRDGQTFRCTRQRTVQRRNGMH